MRIFDNPHSKYEFHKVLGRGGTSVVYLVRHKLLGELRALKAIPKSETNHRSYFAETSILSRMKIKGIPQLYDVEEDENYWYILEEYIQGIAFRDYIESEERTLKELLQVICGICDILDALHHMEPVGVVYNDLKPENLIVTQTGIYLVDFGNCRWFDETMIFGKSSVFSVSPEQLSGESPDAATDVYGIGALLQVICQSNRAVFTAQNVELWEVIHEVIDGCMEKNRNDRFPTPLQVKQYLLRQMNGEHFVTLNGNTHSRSMTDSTFQNNAFQDYNLSDRILSDGNYYDDSFSDNRLSGYGMTDRIGNRCTAANRFREVYVYGSRRYAGVTHFSAGYAAYLSAVGRHAVYVEHKQRETGSLLEMLDTELPGVVKKDGMMIFHKCVMWPDYEAFVNEDNEEGRDTGMIYIHDCGFPGACEERADSSKRRIFLVTDIKSYGHFRYVEEQEEEYDLYIANFSDRQGYRRFKRTMRSDVLKMPFFESPFVRGREVREFYAKVTKKLQEGS